MWLADTYQMQAVEVHLEAANCGVIYPIPRRIPVIVTGKSKRPCPSGRHAVVAMTVGMDGFELLHDPHESGDGLDGEPTHVVFFCQMRPRLLAERDAELSQLRAEIERLRDKLSERMR